MSYRSAVKHRNTKFFEEYKHHFKSQQVDLPRSCITTDGVRKKIVLLCSGESALDLTLKQLYWLRDAADAIIAVNKSMIYANLVGVVPSHLFLMDAHTAESRYALQRSFDFCFDHQISLYGSILRNKVSNNITCCPEEFLSSIESCVSVKDVKSLRDLSSDQLRIYYGSKLGKIKFLAPASSENYFLNWQPWNDPSNTWSRSLTRDLFHFRGSFTSLLNYVCIKHPCSDIYAIGADFYGSQYFFQDEIDSELSSCWGDCWTKPLIAKSGLHFSAQSYRGSSMFDQSEYIVQQLNAFGCKLFSFNSRSLLVTAKMAAPVDSEGG